MDFIEKEKNLLFMANYAMVKTVISLGFMFIGFYWYTRKRRPVTNVQKLNFAVLASIGERDIDKFKSAVDAKLEVCPGDFNCSPGGNFFFHMVSVCDQKDDAKLFGNLSENLAKNANFYTKALDYLLEKKCDINLKDEQGRTALFAACWWNCGYMAHLFLDRGADPNIKIEVFYNFRIMSCLLYKKYYDLAEKLFTNQRADFSAILNDTRSFRSTFRDDVTDGDVKRMVSFVTLFQRRKQILQTLCAANSTKNVSEKSCLEQMDESNMHYFIRNYLIKDF